MEVKQNCSCKLSKKSNRKNGLKEALMKHSNSTNTGRYFNDGIRRIDFVLVYRKFRKHTPKYIQFEQRRAYYLQQMNNHGVETECEEVEDNGDTIYFVKVHAPFFSLCRIADHLKIEMPLKLKDRFKFTLFRHYLGEIWSKFFNCFYCSEIGKQTASENDSTVFYPFNNKELHMYDITEEEKFFSDSQRNEMVWEILQNIPNHLEDEKMRGIESLLQNKVFETAYPLHENYFDNFFHKCLQKPESLRQKLMDSWANWRNVFSLQPIHQIRNYFGEKIGFYFVFMDFYTKQLVFPSIVGLIVLIIGIMLYWKDEEILAICNKDGIPGKYWMCPICEPPYCAPWLLSEDGCFKYKWEFALDNEGTVALSCIILLWGILFFKFWKRRESCVASEWNTYNFKLYDASIRPEYEKRAPKCRQNPVTLESEPHVPLIMRSASISLSILATVLILCAYGLCLVGLVLSRIALYRVFQQAGGHLAKYNIDYSRWCINLSTFFLVTITAKIYNKLVLKLTSYECPRTQHEFMSSLLWKCFLFELVNEFIPICYAAWLKGRVVETPLHLGVMSELCDGGCMAEVVELVFVLLFAKLLFGNIIELGIPLLKNCIKRIQRKKFANEDNLPQWLKDYYLNEVVLDGVYEEYMEMMIQFAFIIFFISAFPVAPILCLINNIVEIRLDATKMLKANRRPVPMRVCGIQIWNNFLDIILKLGVLFNAGLIAFTSDIVPRLFYMYNYNGQCYRHHGFTAYSLSYINISDFNSSEKMMIFEERGIEQCYYTGYREPRNPYNYKADFWILATYRVVAFAVYALIFFVIMWIINAAISDNPDRIKVKVARQTIIGKKYFKTESRKLVQTDSIDSDYENCEEKI